MTSPTVWIVGGIDKGNDYSVLYPFVNEKVKAIICLGKQNDKLFKNFQSMVDTIVETQFMSEAVKIAYKIAEAGDNVLLSPVVRVLIYLKIMKTEVNNLKPQLENYKMSISITNIKGDRMIWAIVALLAIFSFLPVYSAASNLAYSGGEGRTFSYFIKHFVHLFLGFSIIYGSS